MSIEPKKRNYKAILKKIAGVALVILGVAALVTPFTPGAWLILIGFGLLEFRLVLWDRIKAKFRR
ncbi:MAG: hypothetical protein A3C85_00835 [Candidatus Doudnabacteria bacterium RIFCSPHIGHO2_02_FULL_48_21]|uniref:Uncharacterized protein n=1 Tax=Candidatus Doudnabacteria bacterium RIFCSPLOWO2_02_FULL_48_13 TaxID=1817845 RepID=A0A1F5QB78_9BACT|nr:MAG: hypothetical protein A3K05_01770 [Candidatus Doudnabacteria bacterium RIFCSPHIGHO2_01_48_18]OGE77309.1 MAG: hypothetical protein A2668_02680 [Candidatus Doudnabacteria bacterium RIFCSPHIGHO2_01_FULL_48_180]OGE91011.1 MAG: hypothetical protein A3F44_01655 [Candidatus Doudnabacteria bacterium RIFCSPHIGHO2_12_FULL_47_25]OGE92847.1 MAG: hypothetical protein A3C85_00835 [Candidatus Doudnabacteria bacterium RIFCSPHIGHO2_02_FULL_48_21]OGE96880.1 MAG: hypothetical protein A3A83_04075 [Candidatu